MKYRYMFYKDKIDGKWIDNLIAWWTGLFNWGSPRCAHVEVWKADTDNPQLWNEWGFGWIGSYEKQENTVIMGEMFTSTMRGEDNGTVIRPASKVLKNPERWFYYEVECDDMDFECAWQWALNECANNKGYGKRTILKFFGIPWIDKQRNICSQACHKFAVLCGNLPEPPKIPSPTRLAQWLEDAGFERKEMT